jgi:hypothetical protein
MKGMSIINLREGGHGKRNKYLAINIELIEHGNTTGKKSGLIGSISKIIYQNSLANHY